MSQRIGFDRRIDLAWLDSVASRYCETRDPRKAFDETRSLVELTVGGGSSPHNAAGKTMTVLARIWLRVPEARASLRDQAAAEIANMSPPDRLAVHWAMTELAYPFFLDAATSAGRLLRLQDHITTAQFRLRLSEQWGSRGTMPQAAQRILRTWCNWGVLLEVGKGMYKLAVRTPVGDVATRLAIAARLAAEPGKPIAIADLPQLPDFFPFDIGNLRAALKNNSALAVVGSAVIATGHSD